MPHPLSPTEILAASGGDRYVQAAVGNGTVGDAWAADGALVWVNASHGRTRFSGVGPPAAAARLLAQVRDQVPAATRASLPRGWLAHLPTTVTATPLADWDWLWTTTPPPQLAAEDRARRLTVADLPAVRTLLEESSPGTSTWPGDDAAVRWAGLVAADGSLAACLADTSRSAAVGHISSVATAHAHRRNGYGAALTAWTTRGLLAEGKSAVTLGMYADNDAARALYLRLGFACDHAFTAAELTGDRAPAVSASGCGTGT
ncbi:MAG: GNAT family N-acetyltransferase [Streptosporangiales bacterium]|nr:GNAT family N-acetyltransferase [Streptosporangiales bacterium]